MPIMQATLPVEDTEIVLLDSAGEPTAVVGEIAIRSPYVALGYWQQPELTQSRFLPDADQEYQRTYRTGDIGRLRPDGLLEFLGRADHQVKIHGFRIELGEIEAALSRHPAVHDAVVMLREDIPGDKRLVAYVVPQPTQDLDADRLHAFLAARLPAYMLPATFVALAQLPHTPNGKLDRRALPAPICARPELEEAGVAPRTPGEVVLAEIWKSVLNLEHVGVYDNFFDLGGDSLSTLQVISSIEQRTALRLHSKDLLFQTLGQLASACEARIPVPQPAGRTGRTWVVLQAITGLIARRATARH